MPRQLELSDKAVELMAFLTTQADPTKEKILSALWPRKSVEDGGELLDETKAEVNRVVAAASGNITPVITVPVRCRREVRLGRAPDCWCGCSESRAWSSTRMMKVCLATSC
jgi:hypothetical protein